MKAVQGQTAGFADTDANQMYHLAERVAKLEAIVPHSATKADINKVLEEIAKVRGEITAFKGEVKNNFTKVNGRLEGEVKNNFTKVNARLERLEERLDRIEERLDRMDKRFDQQDKRFYQLAGLILICTAVVLAHVNPDVANFVTGLIDVILR